MDVCTKAELPRLKMSGVGMAGPQGVGTVASAHSVFLVGYT